MLLQFSVENFLSFREAGVLSMLAAEGVEHPAHMVMDGPGGKKVLRCAGIYGANASGKSNLIKALEFVVKLALEGRRPGELLYTRPFKLDAACTEKPSRFELHFWVGLVHYSYGLEIDSRSILQEWLIETRGDLEVSWFEREGSRIDIGDAFALTPERRSFVQFVAEGTRKNQPFLAEARERDVHELRAVMAELERVHLIRPSAPARSVVDLLRKDEGFAAFAARLLHDASTGVLSLAVEKSRGRLDWGDTPSDRIEHSLGHQLMSGLVDFFAPDVGTEIIITKRTDESGREVRFGIFEESDGTQRLLQLSPTLYEVETGPHSTLVAIDELERSLHPLLTRAFLNRFLSAGGTSQLLFTTHDTNLLDLNLLSRDAIWFTEKDHAGATVLYSLAEFKAEQIAALGPQIEKGYLQGRFGAIPFLGDATRLGWKKEAAE
jgi:uncharacterized protein